MNDLKNKKFKRMNTLARDANKKFTLNKYLHKILELYKHYNIYTKEILTKCISDKSNTSSISYLSKYSNTIKKDYDKFKNDYDSVFSKFNKLLDECRCETTMGKPTLNQKINEEFILDYLKIEKNNIINLIKKSIESSKEYNLFRENKRNNLIDIKKGSKILNKTTLALQKKLLSECKKCNKLSNKNNKYKSKIVGISNNIQLLNKYIEKNKFKFSNNRKFSRKPTKELQNGNQVLNKKQILINSEKIYNISNLANKFQEDIFQNNSDDDRGTKKDKKSKNTIIFDFLKIENLFDPTNEEGENEKIIDNELHSDDESIFENKIMFPSQISTNYLKEIKKTIPSFNFKQILFNNNKAKEIDIYSLQRRKYEKKKIKNKIKEMRKKVDKISNKFSILKQKENIMREFVKKLEENYEAIKPMICQNSEANIGKTDFIINSLNSGPRMQEKEEDDKFYEFLDNIEEVDEIYFDKNEEKGKNYNEKKETKSSKDTKNTKKEDDEEEKKLEEKIFKNVIKKKGINLKTTINIKKSKRKLLISMPSSYLKNNLEKNSDRPKSR